jgi:DNA repair protein RadA/Sms
MILAVIETRGGATIGAADVFLNIAGGLKITEPAADLAVATAIVSALSGKAIPSDVVVFGEIGLAGEVRAVSRGDARLKEAARLGFSEALAPTKRLTSSESSLSVTPIEHISELNGCLSGILSSRTQSRSTVRV